VADAVDDIDYTAAATLRSLHEFLKKQGIRLVFSGISDHVHAQLKSSGITDLVGDDAFYAFGDSVVRAYKEAQGLRGQ
jgi:anti-anti-sigma regulatory factor